MTEREIFLAVLDLPTAAARSEYLDRVCAGDPARRSRIEALLASHESAGSFLGTPAAALPGPDRSETMAYVPGASAHDEESDYLQFLTPSQRPDSLGRIGHYEVLQVLGKGGFGVVFRAFDYVLQRVVAVKMMAPQMAATSPARKRFLREARTSAAIRHENVVQVYEVAEQPLPYLVMEFIPGETLQQRLDRTGPLDAAEVVRIGRQIAEGLAAAHSTDLIHRDIKPGNVLIESGQHRVKITDFGLARAADDASISQSGIIAGTPMYMAPEQALGQTLDQRADLFSLGSVLYQMAAGRPPFRANNTVAVLKRVAEDTPRSIREIIPETPQWLCDIISKLHAKNPEDRFQSAREVADVLADCETQLKTHAELRNFSLIPEWEPESEAATRSTERLKWAAAILACVLLIPIGIILFTERVGDRSSRQVVKPVGPAPDAVKPGTEPRVKATDVWHGWPADAPPPAIAPFDTAQARAHQEAWAKYLGVPVEYTNSIGMKFRLIPPGEFTMGSTTVEIDAALKDVPPENKHWQDFIKSEAPQHRVILTQPFYLGIHEVTQAQYEQIMGKNPAHFAPTGAGKDAVVGLDVSTHPVETVNWNDAVDFCAKLCKKEQLKPSYFRTGNTVTMLEGSGYRLPTEAEWEYACRAGTTTMFWIGDNNESLISAEWNYSNSGGRTHEVGELKANPLGLFDMHGNVWEWVQDGWESTYYKQFAEKPALNPSGPNSANPYHFLRGGYWRSAQSHSRSSTHCGPPGPEADTGTIGFRVMLPVDAVKTSTQETPVPIAKQATSPPPPSVASRDFALEFDGKSAYVAVPSFRFDIGQPLTIEVRVMFKPSSVKESSSSNYIASVFSPESAMALVRGWQDVPEFFARRDLNFKVAGTSGKLNNHVWIHLAGVWDGKDARLYIDGKQHPIVSLPRSVGAKVTMGLNQPLLFGTSIPTGKVPFHFLLGNLDEIRLSKIARYEKDFHPPMLGDRFQSDEHTLALYHCDEGAGNVLKDSSDNAHHGQIIGATWVKGNGTPIGQTTSITTEPLPPTFKNTLGMEFVKVPKGKSWLGGGKDKLGDKEVEFKEDFYLGKYEITQEEWEKVMGENPSHFARTGNGKDAVKDISDADLKRFPVEEVSWDQCQLFVAKLNKLEKETGWSYRLPSAMEWEYACRGGPMSDKVDGAFEFYLAKPTDILSPERANYNTGTLEEPKGLNRSCRVGSYEPNVLGLFDLHGNAWEWCEDTEEANRVLRGGCWYFDAEYCRAGKSESRPPTTRHKSLGLRLARVPSGVATPEVKTPPSAAMQALRDFVTAKQDVRDQVRLRLEAGQVSKLDLIHAEIDLIEARIQLTQVEGNTAANLEAYRSLVSFREHEHDLIEQKVKAGVSTKDELLRADSSLADANGRLAKALAEAPAVAPK